MIRKALFERTIGFCCFIREDEVGWIEELYQSRFIRWVD
jgi:hypothetical protein